MKEKKKYAYLTTSAGRDTWSREFDTPEEAEKDFKDTIDELNTLWTGYATIFEVVKQYRAIKSIEVK